MALGYVGGFPWTDDYGQISFAPNGSHTSSLATSEFTGLTSRIVGKRFPAGEACLASCLTDQLKSH